MDLQLAEKVIWITGASGGIGRATAELFAAEGARVALHGNSQRDALQEWVEEQPWQERALVVEADVRDADSLVRCANEVAEQWGRIDVCVANAGVWAPGDVHVDQAPPQRLRDTLEVNLLGALFTAGAFFGVLRRAGPRPDGHGASLVFTGSTAGRFGEKFHSDYAASKAGLVGVMRTLKNEIVDLDPRGRVNLVEPGWTVTPMATDVLDEPGRIDRIVRTMPLRQIGLADDVAHTIVHLSSPVAARHLTGQTITVAGGMEGRMLWSDGDVDEGAIRRGIES